MKNLYLIIGKRKAGSTFLYNSIENVWKPSTKDQSWRVLQLQNEEFVNTNHERTGLIAKADAALEFDKLVEFLNIYNVDGFALTLIYINRDVEERRLSFIAHARKSTMVSLDLPAANRKFLDEEALYAKAESRFHELGVAIHKINYRDMLQDDFKCPFNLEFKRTQRVMNSKTQSLPFFYAIDILVSSSIYRRLKYTKGLVKAREFYYRYLSKTKRSNSFVKVRFLAPLSGSVDGQRKLTQLYFENTKYSVRGTDYNLHRSIYAPLVLLFQFVRSLVTCLYSKPDIVYLTLSRTNFGMLRDFLLFSPYRYLRGVRVVAHIHGSDFESHFLADKKFKKFKNLYLASISSFVFIHDSLEPEKNWNYQSVSWVLRNPLPFKNQNLDSGLVSKDQGSRDHLVDRRPAIGFISAFIPGKGLEIFMEIAEGSASLGEFKVAGGTHDKFPDYGVKMQKLLADREDINYLGFLENPQTFYAQCDVILFPTTYASEAVPGVVLEGLVSGCVVFLPRSERLTKVFAGSPVQWFDDPSDCMAQLDRLVGSVKIDELSRAGRLWVANSFPDESDWVKNLDAHVLEVALRDNH